MSSSFLSLAPNTSVHQCETKFCVGCDKTSCSWQTTSSYEPTTYRLSPRDAYVAEEHISIRQRVWRLLDDPSSSRSAQLIALWIMLLIFISSTAFVVETMPENRDVNPEVWRWIDIVCVAFFTLEYAVRLLTCPVLHTFIKNTLNFIDLLSIVPFYIELGFPSTNSPSSAVFRVVRLVRVFRVFKISRYISWVRVFSNAIMASAHPLGMLFFIMMIGLVMFSSAMFYAERGTLDPDTNTYIRIDGQRSPFESIPASFWWCIVTMTTVGYGDNVPITGTGRVIAGITSLCGILVLAIPITVISANFNAELDKMMRMKEINFKKLQALKERVVKAYYDLGEEEKKKLDETDQHRLALADKQTRIDSVRQELLQNVEAQIMLVLEKNHGILMQQIGDLVQKQKGIVVSQIESVLTEVPRFVRKPINQQYLPNKTVVTNHDIDESQNTAQTRYA